MAAPSGFSNSTARWTERDINFVARELGSEFPAVVESRVSAAVKVATESVPAIEGRVSLVKKVRQLLRSKS